MKGLRWFAMKWVARWCGFSCGVQLTPEGETCPHMLVFARNQEAAFYALGVLMAATSDEDDGSPEAVASVPERDWIH